LGASTAGGIRDIHLNDGLGKGCSLCFELPGLTPGISDWATATYRILFSTGLPNQHNHFSQAGQCTGWAEHERFYWGAFGLGPRVASPYAVYRAASSAAAMPGSLSRQGVLRMPIAFLLVSIDIRQLPDGPA